MKIGNIGQLTFVNGDLHFEIDATIAGTVEAPVAADIQVGELLALLEQNVTNSLEKAAIGLVISLLGGVSLKAEKHDLTAIPPLLQELLQLLPSIISAILGGLKVAAPTAELQVAQDT